MAASANGLPHFLPMQTAGTQHLIERTYRESGAFQWVRETLINAFEAQATRVEFGIEWQAVENLGVYRRVIADNGKGMAADELVEFFNTFGGGGKPIGGEHENFGVGSKTSLLPWNRYGMVVISWVDGDASMIWVQCDPETGEFGLRLMDAEDPDTGDTSLDEVYEPFMDEANGVNWAAVKPEWIDDHGTVIVLLGNTPHDDTVVGDPKRDEADTKGISAYLNRRLWEIPDGVSVIVDELRTNKKANWPKTIEQAHGPQVDTGPDVRTNRRSIEGAHFYIKYPGRTFASGKLGASGTVPLGDGTNVDWYLWTGERPAVQSYAAISGYIAAEYRNELYDVTSHHSTYRTFGVAESAVRQRLWLIVRPPHLDEDGKHGVYPRTDRNALLLRGGPQAGGPLPMNEWASEFADNMPAELLAAIKQARTGRTGTVDDATWRQRLADRFGSRWRISKLRVSPSGTVPLFAATGGTDSRLLRVRKPKRRRSSEGGNAGGRTGGMNTGDGPGRELAKRVKLPGGIPHFRAVPASDVSHGMLAAWQPNDPEHSEGVVLINVEHPVLVTEIEHWHRSTRTMSLTKWPTRSSRPTGRSQWPRLPTPSISRDCSRRGPLTLICAPMRR